MITGRIKSATMGTLFVALGIVASGCTVRLLDFTAISSKNVNMPIPASSKSNVRVTGEDNVFAFFGLPFGTPSLKSAVDHAIESGGTGYDALIDGVVYRTSGLFSIGYKVEGTAVKTTALRAALVSQPVLFHSTLGLSNAQGIEQIGIKEVARTTDDSSAVTKPNTP